jgi:hypothetical protein
MLGVTLFGIFLTPVFYYVIEWCNDVWRGRKSPRSSRVVAWLRSIVSRRARGPLVAEPAATAKLPAS